MSLKKSTIAFLLLPAILLLACNGSKKKEPSAKAKKVVVDSVMVGAEVLLKNHMDQLEDKRVGLVMNPTARVNGTHMLDTLLSRDVNITALFAPEHGFRGEAGAGEVIADGVDKSTGLPVYSLYGKTRKPTPEMLENVDVLLFDMQGVGARFYTYNATLGLVLEAAADSEVPVWVLDRPNPAGGEYVAGWLLEQQFKSFVGAYPIPMAHGMTLGELAQMMIGERWLQTVKQPKLKVIPMRGWKRSMKWPQTGLKWYPPSPNLPTFEHAYMYLGTVLFEGTNLSEGRGTPDPFLTIGSPNTELADEQLDSLQTRFPSVAISRAEFTPESIPGKALNPKLEGQSCSGVSLSIKDYQKFNPVQFGLQLLELMLKNTKNAEMNEFIYKLAGSRDVEDFSSDWGIGVDVFREAREPYLIYQ